MKQKTLEVKRILVAFIILLMLLITHTETAFGVTSGDGKTVATAKVINTAYNNRIIDKNVRFNFSESNCTFYWKKGWKENNQYKQVKRRDSSNMWGYALKCDSSKSNEYTNPLKLTFENCGKINGRQVNISINFDEVTIGKKNNKGLKEDEIDGYATIFQIGKDSRSNIFELFSSSTTTMGGYRGKKTAQLTTTVTYADTGETVNLPFTMAVADIDQVNTYATEAWTATSGYKSFYIYSTNNTNRNGNKISAISATSGDDELKKGGIYAITNNGKFTCTFEAGNAGTDYKLFSQYKDGSLSMPTKRVDKSTAKPTDTLTYTINQKIGTYITTMMEPYGKLKITDTIPNYLNYVDGSAKLYSGTEDITNQANISYNSSNKLLTCELKDSWRTNVANYNGQTLRLEFKGKVRRFEDKSITIKNKGNVQVETNLTNETNEVETVAEQWKQNDGSEYIRLRIRIKDDKDVLMDAHGKPTFIFKITANGREYYRNVTFGDDDASKDWTFEKKNGYIIATGKMEDLRESGEDKVTCEVSTVGVSRFKITAEDMIPEFPKEDSDDVCFTYPFVAEKTTWQYYSHNDIKVNRLTK